MCRRSFQYRSPFDEVEKLSGGSLILRIVIKVIKQTLSLGIIWNIIKICICCVKYKNQVDRRYFLETANSLHFHPFKLLNLKLNTFNIPRISQKKFSQIQKQLNNAWIVDLRYRNYKQCLNLLLRQQECTIVCWSTIEIFQRIGC
ncbi:Hypothetical_protein [Hexamita inflata]|uniref:Hypothetical_protein n=1 Tax=Hexamita inflata TaxID=28002 RepID=A0AA86RIM8_9EUKA|nr:Hypothetical protein HINF_LOCUS66426 [Hexamita inflata]